jgi:hypothetical protein
MPITFDPNNPISDDYQPEEPKKPQAPKAQPPKPPQQKKKDQPDFQDMVDSVPGLREAAGTLLNLPQAIADAVPDIPGVPQPLDLLPKPVGDAVKNTIETLNTVANPAVGVSKFVANTALQGKKSNEASRAVAGGLVDFGEGIVNLPTQIVQGITGRPWYTPINTGLIPENSTTAGQGLRTLARYAFASAVPIPGLSGASGLGVKAAAQRAGEGFVQDFAAASGDTTDNTFIGNIPGLRALQTNEAYSPLLNRAVVGLEGALFNAGFGEAGEALQRLLARKKAGKPIIGDPQAQSDLALVNSVGPTMKYGGSPNELVVDGLKASSRPTSLPTVPFTAPSLRAETIPTQSASPAPTNFKPVDMSSRNVQSINFENSNGQPGFDLWFADKRFPALLPGTVKKVGRQGSRGRGYGNYIVVESTDPKTGDKVDVLYAHLADGGIKVKEGDQVVPGMELGTQGGTGRVVSSDGTIASVDFLAPAAKESKSMRPYKRFAELRRELAEQIQKGGITPGQAQQVMADAAAAMPTGAADEAIQQADEQLQALTRKEALDAGYEVSELIPVAPRNDVNEVAAEMIKRGPDISVENTARPAVFSLTDNEIRAIAGSSEEALNWANNLAKTVDYEKVKSLSGLEDLDIEQIRSQAREQFGDILDMSDEEFSGFLDQISITDKQGRTTVTDEGIFALTYKLNELASQTTDLAKAAENAEINGQNPQLLYLRAIDRGMAMMQLEKVANKADSWNLARRGALRNEDQVLTKAAQEQINANQEAQALRDARFSLMKEARDAILRGDEAWLEKMPAALKALQMVGAKPKEQLNVWKTLASSVLKSGDAGFTGSLLTGPGTQSLNFQSVLFNGFGHPALAYLAKVMPGPENKQVREQAVAALSATFDTVRDLNNLIPKLWSNQEISPEMLGREFVGLDATTSQRVEQIKAKLEAGELSDAQAAFYNIAVKLHDLVQSPWITGTVRRTIGTFDKIADVAAGRQVAYRKAYLDALSLMGDAPVTEAYRQKFSKLVESQRKQYLKAIFDDDGVTLLDDEAKQLSDAFAFRTDVDSLDKITKSMIMAAETPGMKMLGLTFVRSPAAMMRAMTRFTPGLSNALMAFDKTYKNGTPYQKAFIEGANALGWFVGISSYINGYLGIQTGAGPLRGQERDSWTESNNPFEIRLPGDASIKYQWLEPLSSPMGFFADLGYYTRYGAEQGLEDNFARGLVYAMARIIPSAGSNIINKSYFTQLATISQLTDLGRASSYKKLGENIASGLVPLAGLRSQVGNVIDPLYRELRSELLNTFSYFIEKRGGLGLSRFAPEDLDDVTGKPLYKNGVDGDLQSSLLQAFNLFRPLGVSVSKNRFKPVHKYLTEVGIDVADSRDKILGMPLTNEERTQFTRYMTQGGQFEQELLRYFKSKSYDFDKEESSRQLLQGYKPSETVAYQQVNKIIANYTMLAMYEMGKGLTPISSGFMNRRSQQVNTARMEAYDRQQRQVQQLREYPFQ